MGRTCPRCRYSGDWIQPGEALTYAQRKVRGPVTLPNGRTVVHAIMPNGAQAADMQDGGPMSETEWQDYSRILTLKWQDYCARILTPNQ